MEKLKKEIIDSIRIYHTNLTVEFLQPLSIKILINYLHPDRRQEYKDKYKSLKK